VEKLCDLKKSWATLEQHDKRLQVNQHLPLGLPLSRRPEGLRSIGSVQVFISEAAPQYSSQRSSQLLNRSERSVHATCRTMTPAAFVHEDKILKGRRRTHSLI